MLATESPPERLLTPEELAEALGISVRGVYRLVEQDIPHYRVGRQIRFDKDTVLRALEPRRVAVGE